MTPGCLKYTPESLQKELFSQNEGLEELINRQIDPSSQGILILSTSWAVDLNLEEKQGVICDALLIAQNRPPILYTILRGQDAEGQSYCTRTAFTLKQKLVNAGLPIVDIQELKEKTERITGTPRHIAKGDRVVAEVISRDGDILDRIYNVPQNI